MADKSTFIKLDRNIQDWRWYKDGNTFRVFIHLLLNANVKKHGFKGYDIQRGQIASSYKSISNSLGMTEMQTRTAIKHLKLTGEITSQLCHDFSLFTVVNYELYQDYITPQVTGKQQADNRQITSKQQRYKNVKNDKNVRSSSSEPLPLPTQTDVFSFAAENDLQNVDCVQFFTHYDNSGWKTKKGEPITDWQSLLIRWNKSEKKKPEKPKADYAAYDIDLFEKMIDEKE